MRRTVLALAIVVAACGGNQSLLPEHEVDLFEFGIEAAPAWSRSQLLSIKNSGDFSHTLVVSQDDGDVVFASDIVPPGEVVDVSIDLPTGEYELSCRLVARTDEGDVIDHYEKGMRADLLISG